MKLDTVSIKLMPVISLSTWHQVLALSLGLEILTVRFSGALDALYFTAQTANVHCYKIFQ